MAVDDDPIKWNVDLEVNLFHAMRKHKPVGVNRHFQMVCIHEKVNNSVSRRVSSKQIWEHLLEMYDLSALNESEILPFPNKELDFQLPNSEFEDVFEQEFPRMKKEAPPKKEPPPAPEESVPTPKSASKGRSGSASSSKDEDSRDATETEKSPKKDLRENREQRKRTRQSAALSSAQNSPAGSSTDTPPTTKRARRI